jgi:DNA-binding Lrp family transcriptional regulator
VVQAYVLIQTEPGRAGARVSADVAEVKGVVSAEDVSGPYDVIVRIQAPSLDRLARNVVSRIQRVDGITRTLVCPIVRLS